MPAAKVLGVYKVKGHDEVHLVEVEGDAPGADIEMPSFTQAVAGEPRENWQVPYDEKLLTPDGEDIAADLFMGDDLVGSGPFRLAFFFHDLDLAAPLETPFGDVDLPSPEKMPRHLRKLIPYESP